MKIAYLGDYFAGNSSSPPLIGEELSSLFRGCDEVFVNFEGPIQPGIDVAEAFKTGPTLCQSAHSLEFLSKSGVTAISIANNHSNDYGEVGLYRTLAEAERVGIKVAGLSRYNSPCPVITEVGGLKVATLAFSEEEWCGPRNTEKCISIFDTVDVVRAVKLLGNETDAVVVMLHANNEYNNLPSPELLKHVRFFIECGADAVLVHHSHVISGVEYYEGRPIVYGLGNFQFAMKSVNPSWYEGLCAVLDFSRNDENILLVSVEVHPIFFNSVNYSVEMATGEQKSQILREVASLSIIISSEDSITANFSEFVCQHQSMFNEMLNPFVQSNMLLRFIGRLFVKYFLLKDKRFTVLLNSYRCQSHRCAIIHSLSSGLNKKKVK